MAKYRIGIDIGGTFTDAVCIDEGGKIVTYKASSTPPTFVEGFFNSVAGLAEMLKMPANKLMEQCILITHGTTIATNAIVTGSGAKIGFITTKGHRDVLHIAGGAWGKVSGIDEDELKHTGLLDKPIPLVPKTLIREVTERVDYKGAEIVALNLEETEQAVDELAKEGVEAVGVCLLWSFKNPAHEREVRGIIASRYPGISVSLSSELVGMIGEFPRSSTTMVNAYLTPVFQKYTRTIVGRLREMGYKNRLLIMEAFGGNMSVEAASDRPVFTVNSGPVGGLSGSQYVGSKIGQKNIICTDMGGTSFDIGLIEGGLPLVKSESSVARYPVYFPSVDVESIGSGGGSIVWTDEMGILKVGPRSSAAIPGPACYDRGGEEPTVTDADLILGYLNPNYFLGGRMKLKKEKSEAAMKKVAEPLGMDVVEAAAAAFRVVNSQMADFIRRKTIEAGFDPRKFVLFAYGGAGPVHSSAFSRDLGVLRMVVPLGDRASGFCSYGMLSTDIRHVFTVSDTIKAPFDPSRVNAKFNELEDQARQDLQEKEGLTEKHIQIIRTATMKFGYQIFEVEVNIPLGEIKDMDDIVNRFIRRYEELYGKGTGFKAAGVEIVTYKVYGIGKLDRPTIAQIPRRASFKEEGISKKAREVFSPQYGKFESTEIYDGNKLKAGDRIEGPGIIEFPGTTVLLLLGDMAELDSYGNIVVNFEGKDKRWER